MLETTKQENAGTASQRLVMVKLVHTAVWAFFAGCIVALPVAGWMQRFDWALGLTLCVLAECLLLGLNRARCPLTAIAARYTNDRSANFDIYLPEWLAAHNKTVFGPLFVFNEAIVIWLWGHR